MRVMAAGVAPWDAIIREGKRKLTTLFDAGRITARVGSVFPLSEARLAQEMLAGVPHKPGKIVLEIGHPQ